MRVLREQVGGAIKVDGAAGAEKLEANEVIGQQQVTVGVTGFGGPAAAGVPVPALAPAAPGNPVERAQAVVRRLNAAVAMLGREGNGLRNTLAMVANGFNPHAQSPINDSPRCSMGCGSPGASWKSSFTTSRPT